MSDAKVTIVTGGAVGLGAATAELFAAAGASVVVADLDAAAAQETVDRIVAAGGIASFQRTDVSRAADVEAMVATAVDRYGRLDCAVNNAAVIPAAKHGVIGLTKVASLESAPRGVRVNAVCPGAMDTPMIRASVQRRGTTEAEFAPTLSLLGRFAQPREVAEACLWLCSDAASYITGATLAVDAGYTSR